MAAIIGKTIRHGQQTWRVINGTFQVEVFGWHPTGPNPRFSWQTVKEKRVPKEVRELA